MLERIDKMSLQARVLLATVISLLFFVPYTYFFAPPPKTEQTTQKRQVKKEESDKTLPTLDNSASQEVIPETLLSDQGDLLVRVEGKHFRFTIDSLGRIAQVYLKDSKFIKDKKELPLLDPQTSLRPLELRFMDSVLNKAAFATPYEADRREIELADEPQNLLLTQTLEGVVVTKRLTFYPDGSYDISVDVQGGSSRRFFLSPGNRPIAENDRFVFNGVLIKESDQKIAVFEDGDISKDEVLEGARFIASVDRYYTTLLFAPESGFRAVISKDGKKNPHPFIEGDGSLSLRGYIGPKDHRTLGEIHPLLTDVIEYGMITFFARPLFLLLDWLYRFCGNWGWAIVLLTIIVRLLLFPLTYKGMVSMQKLKELTPKMKEIQEKYKGDPQKLQIHMMDLYKKHGANPMGGCLPLILQMPIFFAIYRVLYNAIELKGAEWILWIHDLSVMDTYFVLPILMGVSMYVQQSLSPTNFTDPAQEKVFKLLPLIFTFFFITFPSGLVLYWFISNIISIIQQVYINKSFEAQKRAHALGDPKK